MEDDRVNKLKCIIKSLGIESARLIEEKIDLQYIYLKNLKERLDNDELFLKLIILNALVSYQLSTTGERWWKEFSEYPWEDISGDTLEEYIRFLSNSKGNRRFLEGKIKRLYKLKYLLSTLSLERFKNYYNNMELLRNSLAKVLNTKGSSKTVVFAVKIFGYGGRMVFNRFIPYPYTVEIPKDSRIEKYTAKFTKGDVLKFWNEVAIESGVPPLHIDSLLWPALGDWERVKKPLKSLNEDVCQKVKKLIELV
ncbi:N-glycosylase [Methanofervidicoccus sp. A16]|uniref:N-glycosylase/DNA lyase n=1 Tax=Methanofervidicoccus sp. A16 TaxID=2607662 RepID=UPI00118CFC06|nr:N-glycosylase/DNA lyase [Methanofervidicoccus sp. A16]AXI25523.1 N-glycosylase [Methanofervidicoccus sp. A16]